MRFIFPSRRIHISSPRKVSMHSTRVAFYFSRPEQIVRRQFYSQHKLCYTTGTCSPFLKSKGGGVLMATKKAAKKPAKKKK